MTFTGQIYWVDQDTGLIGQWDSATNAITWLPNSAPAFPDLPITGGAYRDSIYSFGALSALADGRIVSSLGTKYPEAAMVFNPNMDPTSVEYWTAATTPEYFTTPDTMIAITHPSGDVIAHGIRNVVDVDGDADSWIRFSPNGTHTEFAHVVGAAFQFFVYQNLQNPFAHSRAALDSAENLYRTGLADIWVDRYNLTTTAWDVICQSSDTSVTWPILVGVRADGETLVWLELNTSRLLTYSNTDMVWVPIESDSTVLDTATRIGGLTPTASWDTLDPGYTYNSANPQRIQILDDVAYYMRVNEAGDTLLQMMALDLTTGVKTVVFELPETYLTAEGAVTTPDGDWVWDVFRTGYAVLVVPGSPPPPPPDFSGCDCADDFRIEAADLRTGIVRAILEPVSADWQTTLNAVGQGSMDLVTKAIRARDIWPHLTSVYILRTAGGTATQENPVVEGAFIIDKFNAQDSGVTQVGLVTIEEYIYRRVLRSTFDFTDRQQTEIAATIVNTTRTNGIPLTAVAVPSAYSVDRTYEDFDRKNIGEAVDELVASENGIEWKLEHTKSVGGAWSTVMFFEDHVGVTRALMVQSDVEGAGYGLEVDAANHATLVDAFGAGSGGSQLIQTANDTTGIYPQFDATPAYIDIDDDSTLLAQAKGYLAENREPTAIPSLTVPSTDGGVDPALMRNGDTIERVKTNFGAVSYDGAARIISTSWSITAESGISRTYQFAPVSRASESVLNQTVTDECVDCPDIPPVEIDYLMTSIDSILSNVMDTDGQLVTTEVT